MLQAYTQWNSMWKMAGSMSILTTERSKMGCKYKWMLCFSPWGCACVCWQAAAQAPLPLAARLRPAPAVWRLRVPIIRNPMTRTIIPEMPAPPGRGSPLCPAALFVCELECCARVLARAKSLLLIGWRGQGLPVLPKARPSGELATPIGVD